LHLVDYGAANAADKTDRVRLRCIERTRVIKCDIGAVWARKLSREGRFSRLSWAGNQDDTRVGKRCLDDRSSFAVNQ
jgi:hypothetical protein